MMRRIDIKNYKMNELWQSGMDWEDIRRMRM